MKQLEVGEERMQSCSDAAAQLISSKNPQSSEVRETLHQLRYAESVLTLHEVHSTSGLHSWLTFFFLPFMSFNYISQCMLGGAEGFGQEASAGAADSGEVSLLLPGPD